MDNSKNGIIKFIDGAFFVFIVIFLVSLTNSIFVNQIGYFGALLLLIAKSIIIKKNIFRKTGLETALLLMIAAEILSTIFSVNRNQSIHFVLKFLLLIPVLYTINSVTEDLKTAKLYFKIFIGGALISCLIYLYLAYDYIIYNQFQILQSGPSPFQHPITASELISFVVIFLFAFAVNEKVNFKNKIFLWLLFFISAAALLSIYKRTGWMGTFAGIFFILIYLKKWKIVVPLLLLMFFVIIFEKNESDIFIYRFQNSDLKELQHIKTEGRIRDINFDNGSGMIGDYENGLLYTSDFKAFSKTGTPSALISFFKWQNYYCASLTDTRFVLYQKTLDERFVYKTEFLSLGYVNSYTVANGCLYVNDADSGLTIFRNPENLKDTLRLPQFNKVSKIAVDSTTISFVSHKKLEIFKLQNNAPGKKIIDYKFKSNFSLLEKRNNQYFVSENNKLAVYELVGNDLKCYPADKKIQNPCALAFNKDTIFIATLTKEVIRTVFLDGELKVLSRNNLGYSPSNMYYDNGRLFVTHLIQGRLFSFVDKYNQSNFTRFALWRAGWLIFLDQPVFGVGNIDLADLYMQYKRPVDKEVQGHMHNNFMHFLVTLGLIGILAAAYLFLMIFRRLHQIFKQVKTIPFISSYTLGVLGGIVAFLVAGLTEYNFGDHEVITMVWFIIGLTFAFYRTTIILSSKKTLENSR